MISAAPVSPGQEDSQGRLPTDLINFLIESPGCGLMIRGAPGTGKTTLALQLLVGLRPHMGGYYLSPRVGESMLLTHFPWLQQKTRGGEALSPKEGEEGVVYERSETADANGGSRVLERHELRSLEAIAAGEPEPPGLPGVPEGETLEAALFPELDLAYRIVEQNLPQRTAVVLDSLDALALRYRVDESRLYTALSRDLVEAAGVALISVLESVESGIEFLGDGVVELSMGVLDGARIRSMEIKKLRGRQIRRPFQPYTLIGGKIRTFGTSWEPPFPLEGMEKMVRQLDVGEEGSDRTDYRKPIRFLDFFSGGLAPGRTLALELLPNVPAWFRDRAELITVAWAGRMKRPALVVGTRHRTNTETSRLYGHFQYLFSAGNRLRIVSFGEASGSPLPDRMMRLEGRDIVSDLSWTAVRKGVDENSGPEVVFIDMDVLGSNYGWAALESSGAMVIQELASQGATCVLLWREGFVGRRSISRLATKLVKVSMIHGSLAFVGQLPETPVMLLSSELDPEDGALLWPVY